MCHCVPLPDDTETRRGAGHRFQWPANPPIAPPSVIEEKRASGHKLCDRLYNLWLHDPVVRRRCLMGPRFRNPAIIPTALFLLSALAQAQSVPGSFFPSAGDMWSNEANGCGWVSPTDTPVSITAASGSIKLTCVWDGGRFDGALTYTLPSATPLATEDAGYPYMYRFDAGKTLPIKVEVSGTWTHPALATGIQNLISAQSYAGQPNYGQCGVPDLSGAHQFISSDTLDLPLTCNLTALTTVNDPKLVPHPMGATSFGGNLWFYTGTPIGPNRIDPTYEANIYWSINVYYDFNATPSVKIDHVELLQRTQTVSGGVNAMGVPLMATLPTLVRVFVVPGNSQAQPAVTGTLTVTYADGVLDSGIGSIVTPVASPDRNNLYSSLNFPLLGPFFGTYHPGTAQFSVRLATAAGQDLN